MNSKDLVYVNGSIVPRSEARVSVEDRGFVFGDGVYEVLRVINGRPFATRFHNERLRRSLEGIRIFPPADDTPESFVEIGKQLLRENDLLQGEATMYMAPAKSLSRLTTPASRMKQTSRRPSVTEARGAILKAPPSQRPLETVTISIRSRATPPTPLVLTSMPRYPKSCLKAA